MSKAEARARNWPRRLKTERKTVTWRPNWKIENRRPGKYVLEDQVGFLVRAVSQRNTELFAKHMIAGLTRVQFATMVKLLDVGFCCQKVVSFFWIPRRLRVSLDVCASVDTFRRGLTPATAANMYWD
jgi:hypothetical protein